MPTRVSALPPVIQARSVGFDGGRRRGCRRRIVLADSGRGGSSLVAAQVAGDRAAAPLEAM